MRRLYWYDAVILRLVLDDFFRFLGILGPPYCGIGATIRIGREMLCLLYAEFFFLGLKLHLISVSQTKPKYRMFVRLRKNIAIHLK